MTRPKIFGTRKGETLRGTSNSELIFGRSGTDLIFAGAGNDAVAGGRDADVIYGEDGNDRLFGLGGNDHILGGAGNDWINGGEGNDTLEDGAGSDRVYGGNGDDRIIWTPGSSSDCDELHGGNGQDTLQLEFTAKQWTSAMLRSDVARLQSFIAAQLASNQSNDDREFEFRRYRLEVSGFEKLIVKVGGVIVVGGTDTTPPPPPALALTAASDSGLPGDGRTNDATPTLSGRAEAGAVVRVSEGSALLATVTASADGTWSATLPVLSDGPHLLTATATDAAGNVSTPSTPLSLTIDSTRPAAPVLDLLAADDSGANASDNLTNMASVRVSVAAEAGSTVQLGGQSAVATGGVANFTVALAEGLNTLSATATDAAGNVSTAGTLAITRDSTPPAAPVLDLLAADDSGASTIDNLTNMASVRVSVAAEAGSTVQLGGQSAVATGGVANFTVALAEGMNTLSATANDAAGNVSAAGTLAITRDSTGPAAPVLDLLAADDSGANASDNLTNLASVRVSVAAEAGSTVQLGGQSAVATGGVANFTVALNEGLNTLSATATDAAGNVSTAGTLAITRDSTGPATPVLDLLAADDSGANASDNLTNMASVRVSVAAEAGSTVQLGGQSAVATGGVANFTVALNEGLNTLSATAIDAAGNVSTAGTLAITRDSTGPAAPLLDLLAADDSGASTSDNLTNLASVRVSVAAEAGSTVQLGGQSAVATGGVANFTVALAEGLNTLSATATDAAGNVSAAGTLAITRDSTAPGSPSITLDPGSDSGNQGDGRTTDETPTLTGTAEAGAVVTISGADGDLGTVTADAAGQWSFTTEALALGSYALTARALDQAGNESAPSSSFALIIEPTGTPGNLALAVALSDQFQGQTDQSGAAVVTLAGTGTAGEIVRLFDAQGEELAQTIVDVRGGFRFSEVRLELGDNALTVQSFSGATSTGTLAFDVERVDDLTSTNVVLEWVQTALKVFAAEATTPTAGSRALAMIGQAMHNVVAAINDMPGYQFTVAAADGASLNIAVAQAAHDILSSIYPGSAALIDSKLATWLSMTPDGAAENDGRALGQEIAARLIALRADDGWDVAASHEGSNAPGAWQQTGPAYMGALDPQWANLDPFVMNSPSAFDPGAPPEVGSAEWIAAYNEVKELGASDSTTRTADQTQTARFWAQGVGTSTPAGLWAQIAVEASQAGDLSVANTALLFAQLGLAAGDAGIAAWNAKYAYDTWRPVTAIQDADVLGNPDIVADRDWTPYILTPPFPEYVSGHSTFSGAAGQVLEDFFGQNFAFSTTASTFTRSFSSFDAAVEEAGRSRIYGGIHFSFADAAGQQIGRAVGSLVTSLFNGSVDLTPPTIIFDVAQGKVTAGDLIIAGAVSDDLSGVSRVFWSLDGGALNPLTADGEGDFALAFGALGAGLADGSHTVTFFAQDAAGHASTRDFSFTLSTLAADIILDPAGIQSGATLTAPGELVGRVELGAGNGLTALSYTIDGGPPVAMIFGAGGSFDSALDLSGIALGDHTIVITAKDALGNTVQETLDITVDALPFTVTALTPDRNESDVGVTYRPSVSFSRAVDTATLTADSFYVTDASGAKIPATIVPYQDGTGAWLLFDSAMPGAQRMTVHLDGDAIRSVDGTTLDANGAAPGVDLDRYFTTVSTASVAGTSITGLVLDPGADFEPGSRDDVRAGPNGLNDFAGNTYLNPLAGVKVFILGREDLFAITDANGRFTLNDTPTGNVKLVVEGRTATNAPAGFYFPEMVMELNVRAGVVNTAMSSMGPIDAQLDNVGNQALYLPRIDSSILKPVSGTETTVVQGSSVGGTGLTAEQAALIKLTIAPGSFVDDHGNPVAAPQIGIAPVPASLVRDMLPPGVVNHSFDFTIQAPGTSVFTEEVQLTLPNTFGLAPGSKTNVLSFDHTTGRLVINGTATVSADGLTVTTDPGSGVKAPGWHGITDGTSFGHLDASVLCGTLDPSQLLNMQDVEKGLLNIAGLASTLNLVPQTPEAQIANGLLGVQSDRNAIESTMTSLFNAYYAGDTGSVGGPADASFYAIMGSKLLGQLAKTALDIPGVVVGSTPLANTPAGKTLEVLNKMTNAADLIGNYMLDGSGPISDLNAAAQKLAYQVIVSKSGVPGWVPKSNPLTPAAAQNLRDISDTAIQNSTAKQAAAQAYIAKVDTIKALVMDFAGPDGEISAAEVPNILNKRAALSSAIADAAQAGADLANLPDPADDIQAIEDAYNAVQEAFADDLASIIADAEENAGTVPDPDGNAEGAPVYGGTLYYVLVGPEPGDEIRGSFSANGGIDLVFRGSALRADGVIIDRSYSLTIIDPVTHSVATTSFKAALAGTETKIGAATLLPGNAAFQANGYTAQENYVLGLNGNIADNLVPGVPDAVAIKEGLVGTNGLVNGTIASVELADIAQAIVIDASGSNAQGLHAYLATTEGLTVVDVTDANAPKVAAELQLGGSPSDIAIDKATGLVAVAAGTAGVWLVNVADPDNPSIFAQITGATTQVEAIDGIACFASQGFLRAYDMGSASEDSRIAIGGSAVNGMAVDGNTIYTLQADGTVRTFAANDGALQLLGSALIPELAGESQITVANGVLYVPRGSAGILGGFATIDVSDPAAPALISDRDALTVTGGALALVSPEVAVGVDTLPVNTPLGVRLVNSFQVLNISDPAVNDAQISRFELGAQPVDLAVARGLAFVITTKGLEVVRYANTDLAGVPPIITVAAPQDVAPGTAGIQLREGERISFAPAVTDDIGVRQVEMLIDGRVVSTDVTYPYNVTALLPTIAQNGGVATVQISFRAIDTGGNAAVHPGFTVNLVADPTPFTILSTTPVDEGALQGARESLLVVFSKPVDPATVTTANFAVTAANGQVIQPDSIELRNNGATVKLNFASLDAPSYVFLINAPAIRDLAGQALGSTPVQVDFAGTAYSTIWTGGATGDWFNAANWSAGLAPVPAGDVFISLPTGAAVTTNGPRIVVDTLTTAGAGVLSTGNNGLTATALYNDGAFNVTPAALNPDGSLTITTLANTGSFTVAAGGDARILGSTENSGAITVAPNGILTTNGSIDNSGTITLAVPANVGFSSLSTPILEVKGLDVQLTGGGTIALQQEANTGLATGQIQALRAVDPEFGNGFVISQGTVSTLRNVDNTILGAGRILGEMVLINEAGGEIKAGGHGGTLTDPTDGFRYTLSIETYSWSFSTSNAIRLFGQVINRGLIHTADDAQIRFSGEIVDNTGGTIIADGQFSVINLGAGAVISGGTISAGTNGGIYAETGSLLRDIHIISTGVIGSAGNAVNPRDFGLHGDIRLGGAVVLDGQINEVGGSSLALLGGTLTNRGTVWATPGTKIDIAGTETLDGGGYVYMLSAPGFHGVLQAPLRYDIDPDTGNPLPAHRLINVDNQIQGGGLIGGLTTASGSVADNSGVNVNGRGLETFVLENRADGKILGSDTQVALTIDGITIQNDGRIGSFFDGSMQLLNTAITQSATGQIEANSGLLQFRSIDAQTPIDPASPTYFGPTSVTGGRMIVFGGATAETIGVVHFTDVDLLNLEQGTINIKPVGLSADDPYLSSGALYFRGAQIFNSGTINVMAGADSSGTMGLDASLIFDVANDGDTVFLLNNIDKGRIVLGSSNALGTAHIGTSASTMILENGNNIISGTGVIDSQVQLSIGGNGEVVINAGDRLTINSSQTSNNGVIAVQADSAAGDTLTFNNRVDNFASITDDGAGSLVFNGEVVNFGTIASHDAAGAFIFNGRLENNQTVTVDNGGTIAFGGVTFGGGTFAVGAGGGTFDFNAFFAGTINAAGGDATIQIDDLLGYQGMINGFGSGDQVRMDDLDFASAFILGDSSNAFIRTVTISDGVDQVLLRFDAAMSGALTLALDPFDGAGTLLML